MYPEAFGLRQIDCWLHRLSDLLARPSEEVITYAFAHVHEPGKQYLLGYDSTVLGAPTLWSKVCVCSETIPIDLGL